MKNFTNPQESRLCVTVGTSEVFMYNNYIYTERGGTDKILMLILLAVFEVNSAIILHAVIM